MSKLSDMTSASETHKVTDVSEILPKLDHVDPAAAAAAVTAAREALAEKDPLAAFKAVGRIILGAVTKLPL